MSPVFLLLEPIRRLLQKWNNHIFFRATTDRQIILREFSNLINSAISLDLITDSFIKAITNGIDSKEVSVRGDGKETLLISRANVGIREKHEFNF